MIKVAKVNLLLKFPFDDQTRLPIAELKQHVIIFVESPPGPKTVSRVMDFYFAKWGDPFIHYASTAFGASPNPWNKDAQLHFNKYQLPKLRQLSDWGYSFSDGRMTDSWMFMFHGFRPFCESEKSSFFRFEFDWQVNSSKLMEFVRGIVDILPCSSGNAGYCFQGRPRGQFARQSFNQIFAWARRYWGVDAQDLDVTVNHVKSAYKSINWLTVIGEHLQNQFPDEINNAKKAAFSFEERVGGLVFRASDKPILADRHYNQPMAGYIALAEALKNMQIKDHEAFGDGCGSYWTPELTNAWLNRFTDPEWSQ